MDPWAIWDWVATPNPWLDGERPEDAMGRNPGAVSDAVRGLLQE